MDYLSAASTFATLIGFCMQLYSTCKEYVDATRGDCPNDIRLILIESSSLEATLKASQLVIAASDIDRKEADELQRHIGEPLEECKLCLKQLMELVPEPKRLNHDGKLSKRDKAKILLAAVKWGAGDKAKCEMLLKNLRTYKATLTLKITTGLSRDVKKIGDDVSQVRESLNTVHSQLDEHRRNQVYKWLEQVNPSRNHNNAGQLRDKETGQWLAGSKEWTNWIKSSDPERSNPRSRFLWVHGNPGAGKTVLAYTMFENVRSATGSNEKLGLAYYYCDYSRNKDEAAPFIRWVLGQFCRQSKHVPGTLNKLFESGHEPTVAELRECLAAVLNRFQHAYVVVDAVDESQPPENLVSLLSTLGSDDRYANLSLAVTSREMQDIEAVFRPRSVAMSMEKNAGILEDIRRYVRSTLGGQHYRRWPQSLRREVEAILPQKADGMFRYAACQLELLAECESPEQVRGDLKQLPKTLTETYQRILNKINERHIDLCARALSLIIGAQENTGPMLYRNLEEGLKMGKESFIDIDTLRRYCICLIRVRNDETVELSHYTVREFLESKRIPKPQGFALSEGQANKTYLEMILSAAAQFSGTPDIRNMKEDGNGDPVDFRLYALSRARIAMFWDSHTLVSNPATNTLLLKLLDPYAPCYRGLQLLGHDGYHDQGNLEVFEWLPKFNPQADATEKAAAHLTMIVGIGIPALVSKFLEKVPEKQNNVLFHTEMHVVFPAKWDIYSRDGTYDHHATSVTVLDFYKEGEKRGYNTREDLNMLSAYYHKRPDSRSSASSKKGPGPGSTAPAHAHAPTSTTTRGSTSSSQTRRRQWPGHAVAHQQRAVGSAPRHKCEILLISRGSAKVFQHASATTTTTTIITQLERPYGFGWYLQQPQDARSSSGPDHRPQPELEAANSPLATRRWRQSNQCFLRRAFLGFHPW
ncbi:hypothetical protein VTK56DRAFT_5540 [Thermocarpiscus australiensis]